MKKIWTLIFLITPLLSQAQPPEGQDWWACQEVTSSGLTYENGSWGSANFIANKRFVLMADGGGLTPGSVGKVLEDKDGSLIECFTFTIGSSVVCIHKLLGSSLVFNPELGSGSFSYMFGGINNKDSLAVSAFDCAKG